MKNWIGDVNNNGVHEELGWEAYLAQCLHTIQWMKELHDGLDPWLTDCTQIPSFVASARAMYFTSVVDKATRG